VITKNRYLIYEENYEEGVQLKNSIIADIPFNADTLFSSIPKAYLNNAKAYPFLNFKFIRDYPYECFYIFRQRDTIEWHIEEELLPATQHLGVGFFAGAPLAQGVLTGKYQSHIPSTSRGANGHRNAEVQGYLDERSLSIVDALCTAAEGLGISPATTALVWARDRAGVTAAIVGVRHPEQWNEIIDSEKVRLPRAILDALDDISS